MTREPLKLKKYFAKRKGHQSDGKDLENLEVVLNSFLKIVLNSIKLYWHLRMYIECAHFHNDYNVNKMRVNLRYANSSSNLSVLESIEN